MIVVIDASAAVKLVLDEDDSDGARQIWDEAVEVIAPTIVSPEVAAAINAARRAGRTNDDATERAQTAWKELVDTLDQRIVDDGLAGAARDIAATGAIQGMDAIYLAVAREVDDLNSAAALFSFDTRQRAAAEHIGVGLMPASIDGVDDKTDDPASS